MLTIIEQNLDEKEKGRNLSDRSRITVSDITDMLLKTKEDIVWN